MHLVELIKLVRLLKIKVNNQNKNFVYNSHHSFINFKDIDEFKGLSYEPAYKKMENVHKKFTDLKNVTPLSEANKDLTKKSFKRCWRSFYGTVLHLQG